MATIATFAYEGTYDPDVSVKKIRAGIEEAAQVGADLVVFPETALQGYPAAMSRGDEPRVLKSVYEVAEPLDGPRVTELTGAARELGVHVIFGLTERAAQPGVVYNTTVLAGPEGLIGTYRKVHVAIGEQVIWARGRDWPVYDTPIGRIGMLICYDQAWPESCRELTLRGADILVMSTAWSLRPDEASPSEALSVEQYLLYGKVRATENQRWFISSNFTGPLGDLTFFGNSQVIDPLGRVVAESGMKPAQSMVLAEIDVRGGIEAAQARSKGHRLWRDRRPETYTHLTAPAEV
ncbi:MAG TPA: carbon-nitrogen hydrolase family protein [Trebonia sp.]|jgi:predicted amidohydrolase